MAFSKEVLDEILKDYRGPDDFYGPEDIMKMVNPFLDGKTVIFFSYQYGILYY
jgi:hypothetical protein